MAIFSTDPWESTIESNLRQYYNDNLETQLEKATAEGLWQKKKVPSKGGQGAVNWQKATLKQYLARLFVGR